MKNRQKFGLFTSICMIVGIVIGSGLFFKSDNVLIYTNGNIALGVLVFILAAMAIIFGSLTVAELVIRTDKTGGIIAYAEAYLGKRMACVFGWFQNFVYFPTIICVVSWVVGIYFCILFGINATTELQIIIGFLTYIILYIINYTSTKIAGYFQNIATIIKLIPIFLSIIVGILFGDPDFSVVFSNTSSNAYWIAAVAPIAFSYDGWIIATGISHEIKNSHRNLQLALIISPIFILFTYVAYFIGINLLIGPEQIMLLGDSYVDVIANYLFGSLGSKIFLTFIIISIVGAINGIILGSSRGLYALGVNKMIPKSKLLSTINEKWGTPTKAIICSFIITTLWMIIHYLTIKFNILQHSDVSEISIATMYVLYIILYIQVIKLKRTKEIKSIIKGYIIPILAIIGSLFIFFGSMQNPMFWIYGAFSMLIIFIAYFYARKNIV